jgi:hypothetical protein
MNLQIPLCISAIIEICKRVKLLWGLLASGQRLRFLQQEKQSDGPTSALGMTMSIPLFKPML